MNPSNLFKFSIFSTTLLFSITGVNAVVLDITAASGHSVSITGVDYLVNGVPTAQTTPATSRTNVTTDVNLTGITVNDGGSKDLDFYNTANAAIQNNNFISTTGTGNSMGGVGVYMPGSRVRIEDDGLGVYETEVIASATNTNLMNYLFYDRTLTNMPTGGAHDFDLLYHFGWTTDDYLVVAERNGNTNFELTPLGADGNIIPLANTLRFDNDYGWRSGYANDFDEFNNQDMWFSVARIDKFFEGTMVPIGDQVVYGYRIDNDGNADVKFFGASDDTFTNNPVNPLVPVPETSAYALLLGISALVLITTRRER